MRNILMSVRNFALSHRGLVLGLLGVFFVICITSLGSIIYLNLDDLMPENISAGSTASLAAGSNSIGISVTSQSVPSLPDESIISAAESITSADESIASAESGSSASSTQSLHSTAEASSGNESSSSQEVDLMYEYTLERYLAPFWSSKTIYNETLMFVQNQDGTYDAAPLLYTPVKIVSVRSFDLRAEYLEGTDYILENGKIRLTADSSIKAWEYGEYYPAQAIEGRTFQCTRGGFIAFGEGRTFIKTQIAVTYTHNGNWKGIIPETQSEKLRTTLAKLKNKEKTMIAFFGDSITTGANSSGASGINMLPRAPVWPVMIVDRLKDYYGNDQIGYMNGALGGANTAWGTVNYTNVTDSDPDLVIIAFGMNDANLSVQDYKSQIESIITSIRQKNPIAEIILVSTMLPNKEVTGFYGNQYLFEQPLKEIAAQRSYVAIAPVTAMHTTLLESKRYYDMTGNNVNHPNDFLARMYAQTILKVMIGG